MPELETIKLQLAMAFGQGAGVMGASTEALHHVFATNSSLIEQAAESWGVSRWAFVELTRLLGQSSANHAMRNGSAIIRPQDIDAVINVVMDLCPCNALGITRVNRL